MSSSTQDKGWTFVTNHTRLLLCLAQNPDARLRDVAAEVGITERAAQRILADLVDAGYVERERVGRRNRYTLNRDRAMRHETQLGHEIGELLDVLAFDTARPPARSSAGPATA